MLKTYHRIANGLARTADLVCIAVAFVIAVWANPIRSVTWQPTSPGSGPAIAYLLFATISLLAWSSVAHYRGIYRSHRSEAMTYILRLHLKSQLIWMAIVGLAAFAINFGELGRDFLTTFFAYACVLLIMREITVTVLMRQLRQRGYNLRRAVVIGNTDEARTFARFVEENREGGYRVIGLSTITEVLSMAANSTDEPDDIFIMISTSSTEELEPLVLQLLKRGKQVHLVPGIFDVRLFRQQLDEFAGIPILSIGGQGLDFMQTTLKRAFDLIGATLLIVLTFPLLLLIALVVYISSGRPILFAQERLGHRERLFRLYKFRTMVTDAEEVLRSDSSLYVRYVANNFKLPRGEDPRITPLGHILRSTSLDELPQLLNVLKGDMSLVGPRPIVPAELAKYGECAALFLSVKPGLTGNWQVNGRSEIDDYAVRTAMDLEYIRDQSFSTDFRILLKTIPAVIKGKGAH